MFGFRPFAFLALTVLVACSSLGPTNFATRGNQEHRDAADLIAPQLGEDPSDAPDLIEVRTIRIAWAGAEGVSSRITRSEEDASGRADTVSSLLRAPGSNFGEVAREYGDVPPSIDRLRRGSAEPAIFNTAAALSRGEVSHPIRTPGGFVIMNRRADPASGPTTVAARHILIAYAGARRVADTVTRSREEALALATQVRTQALGGGDWTTLHSENTDEPGSPPNGDLGTFGRGQMVPAFERAVFALEVGATGEVVETPFGFHVIQRVE